MRVTKRLAAASSCSTCGVLQQVMAAAARLLREGARALQALDAQLAQQLVLVQVRGVLHAVGLVGRQRHPVDAVVGEQRVPLVVARSSSRRASRQTKSISCWACTSVGCIMAGLTSSASCSCAQARYWLRIEISLVPLAVTSAWPTSAGS